MAGMEVLLRVWKDLGIQLLVLLSFALQVILLITAEIRRRKDSGVLRAAVWSAYLMADSTAIYALGHMSVTSSSPEHQLMAFWAPFLLLHLGGQDNITAYAIEDNRLWLRHLQVLAVQVAAAAYVMYESTILGSESLLLSATILMFLVGVLKYGERVWSLKCASANKEPNKNYKGPRSTENLSNHITINEPRDTEELLRTAHILLNFPKRILERPIRKAHEVVYYRCDGPEFRDKLFMLVEMELSLMHDLLYSKSEVMHTWYGICIRIISSGSTAAALLLFHLSGQPDHRHSYSRVDVAVTYALLVGAIVLETISLLRAMFSSWALADMKLLRPAVSRVRRLVLPESRKWWSDSMGQHNLFELLDRRKTSRSSRMGRWIGMEDWLNTIVHSSRIPVSPKVKRLLVEMAVKIWKAPMERERKVIYEEGELSYVELEERILVCHIATDLFLRWYRVQDLPKVGRGQDLVEVIEALSNYMLFIVVARPHMLPGNPTRAFYSNMCYDLGVRSDIRTQVRKKRSYIRTSFTDKNISTEDFIPTLQAYGSVLNVGIPDNPRKSLCREIDIPDENDTLDRGCKLGAMLIGVEGLFGTPAHRRVHSIAYCQDGWKGASKRHEWKVPLSSEERARADMRIGRRHGNGRRHRIGRAAPSVVEPKRDEDCIAPSVLEPNELGITVTDRLELMVYVWAEMLFDAGKNCGAYPHSKQLSNGGELLTVAAFLTAHLRANMAWDNAATPVDEPPRFVHKPLQLEMSRETRVEIHS